MNTMYRNNEDKNSGYRQIQNTIAGRKDEILLSENIINGAARRKSLLDQIAINSEAEEKNAKKRLYTSAEQISDLSWSMDLKSDIDKYFGYFKYAPKALLHVHSTVGLSVQNLMGLILSWNSKHKDGDGLQIRYAAVKIEHRDKPIENVLMYAHQLEHVDPGWTVLVSGVPDAAWFITEMSDFYMLKQGHINKNWEVFGEIFLRTDHLFQDEGFYKEYHKCFFKECLQDNIRYVELRTGFAEFANWEQTEEIKNSIVFLRPDFNVKDYLYHSEPLNDPEPLKPDTRFLRAIIEARNEAAENHPEKLMVKVILTANRNKAMNNMSDVCKKVDTAIAIKNCIGCYEKDKKYEEYKDEIADMIVGFDFVNKEEKTWGLTEQLHEIMYNKFPYSDDQDPTAKVSKLHEKNRIQLIRFFLHDGESTDIIGDCGSNAVTGPICSRHRIGHGFQMGTADNLNDGTDLYGKHIMHYILNGDKVDVQQQRVREKYPVSTSGVGGKFRRDDCITEPVIELCPISNYMLGYVNDLDQHPAISLMENGIFAVICSDDPQLFNSMGLSYDYAMMYMALKKRFEEEAKQGFNDDREEIVWTMAYDYLKICFFLGYFYEEMSGAYYANENDITVVNDNMKVSDEEDIFKRAADRFKVDWDKFIKSRFAIRQDNKQ